MRCQLPRPSQDEAAENNEDQSLVVIAHDYYFLCSELIGVGCVLANNEEFLEKYIVHRYTADLYIANQEDFTQGAIL